MTNILLVELIRIYCSTKLTMLKYLQPNVFFLAGKWETSLNVRQNTVNVNPGYDQNYINFLLLK